jgi:hypothetical protein
MATKKIGKINEMRPKVRSHLHTSTTATSITKHRHPENLKSQDGKETKTANPSAENFSTLGPEQGRSE